MKYNFALFFILAMSKKRFEIIIYNSSIICIGIPHSQENFILVHIVKLAQLFSAHHNHHNRQNQPHAEGLL